MSELDNILKVRFKAERERGLLTFNPKNVHVELNGVPVHLLKELTIHMDVKSFSPTATLKMTLSDLDIDADTLVALEAFVKNDSQILKDIDEARGQNGESSSEERNTE